MQQDAMPESSVRGLDLLCRGKVRDIYDLGDEILIVATDRSSCFDVVLPTPIPGKGRVLTKMSRFWFERTGHIIPNHLVGTGLGDLIDDEETVALLAGRAMIVNKARPLPIESVVRGYLSGSAWREYREKGTVCGIALPSGLRESDKLAEPIFTPATKAERGLHDENISFEGTVKIAGDDLAERIRQASLRLYVEASSYAAERGIIVADTKFEFGIIQGELTLIDEALTPDSSRFWPADGYEPGGPQPSFDKQFVRDYLESIGFDKKPPAPELPDEVVQKTADKYREALRLLTGEKV